MWYLERNPAKYDVIILDPPPPVQTAGSSLLYSQDFYTVAKKRLEPGGILQQWLPQADNATQAAVARSIKNSFAYVKVYRGIEAYGWHFLASDQPITDRTAAELVARMPAAAVKDMMEWGPAATPEAQMSMLLDHTTTAENLIALDPAIPALSDDRPINEFFMVRTPFDQVMAMESPDF
jgi:spermidine synthase